MTLFDLAKKNIKNSFKNYFLYFVSMIFSIMIYYMFVSIQTNEQVRSLSSTSYKIIELLQVGSVLVAFFSCIFIWYSNSFFARKRKKELAVYSLLGVRKKQIARMMFYETFILGIIALFIAFILGTLLSKVFIMFLIKSMGYIVSVDFVINPQAMINTAKLFIVIFVFVGLHDYSIIYRFKLIDLLYADKKSEKPPKTSIIVAILSILCIGFGYYLALNSLNVEFFKYALATIFFTVLGTYGLFHSSIYFIVKLSKKNKSRYYKGTNMIRSSQMLYKIKSYSTTLATIAIMTAITITAVGTTYSFYYNRAEKVKKDLPFDYSYSTYDDVDVVFDGIISVIEDDPNATLANSVEITSVVLNAEFDSLKTSNDFLSYDVISESMANEILKVTNLLDPIEITSNEVIITNSKYLNFIYGENYFDLIGSDISLLSETENKELKIKDIEPQNLLTSYITGITLVVEDSVFNDLLLIDDTEKQNFKLINVSGDSIQLSEKILEVSKNNSYVFSYLSTFISTMESSGMIFFTGCFLGLVFILSTGSLIYFKQLRDIDDDIKNYRILKNIGVSYNEIKSSLSKQILFVFVVPLMIGSIHSSVALSVLSEILAEDLTIPIISCIAAYTVIYMVYYRITLKSYFSSIKASLK